MSYEEFFHLNDSPFRLTPDPDYFFPSGGHKEALDTMVYSISSGEGFIMITGAPGVGKTLLVRKLLRELGDKVNRALVLNPAISPRELLSAILDDLGVTSMEESQDTSKELLLRRFRDYLLSRSSKGTKTIIIIDEAQNLPKDTLEELRMLSNLESDREKLLQIILVGQLELEERLAYDDMKQLAQRISIRSRLRPLSSEETGAYIHHRLHVAGDDNGIRFRPRVIGRIHALSNGIPRRINLICERALMAAYVAGEKSVSKKHLVRAIKSIEGHEEKAALVPARLWPILGGAAVIVAALWIALQYTSEVPSGKDVSVPHPIAQTEKPGSSARSPQDVSSKPESPVLPPESKGESVPEPIAKTGFRTNARVQPEITPPPVAASEEAANPAPAASDLEASSPETEEEYARHLASNTQNHGTQASVPGPPPKASDIESYAPSSFSDLEAPSAGIESALARRQATGTRYQAPPPPSSLSMQPPPPAKESYTPPTASNRPQPDVETHIAANLPATEAPNLRQPAGEPVQYLDEKAGPALLPVNEYYLAVDRDRNLARLWQGGASGAVLKHEFDLEWVIMDGLYLLGNDKKKGPFIFSPVFLQMGGYNMPNTAAIWDQVADYVTDGLVPVIVYSSSKMDKELLSSDIPSIRDIISKWAQAWRDRDMTTLMSFYGKSFTAYSLDSDKPETYPLADLTEIRSRTLGTSSYISLTTSPPVIITDPQSRDFAIGVFRQEYKSSNYSDKGIKALYLRREGSFPERSWKIVAKFFLPEE